MERRTIETVAKRGLCCGCGTCQALCLQNAVKLEIDESGRIYIPTINEKLCVHCNLCYDICPGGEVDFKALNMDIFGRDFQDNLMGIYKRCYIGFASNEEIRYNAASGGAVTAILIFALENGLIDGALVTRMSKKNPLEAETFIARTTHEIIEASKSKYGPVPANRMLKEILDSEGEKFAVVGLPCHIHGIRKAELITPKLKEKIALHIGLFCSHADTFWQIESLIKRLRISKDDIENICYRGNGWPGIMTIRLKDGRIIKIPYHDAMSLHGLWIHAMPRCLFCCDLTSELSDISCGDPWLPEVMRNETEGKSIIISRNDIGDKFCKGAEQQGYLQIDAIEPARVKQSGDMMVSKKKDIEVRFILRRILKKPIPIYNTQLLKPEAVNFLRSALVYFNTSASNKKYLRKFITLISCMELWSMKHVRGR